MLSKPSPEQLEFRRLTAGRPLAAIAYRSVRIAVRCFGERRVLAALTDLARLSHRLAYESASRFLGDDEFLNAGLALDEEIIRRALPTDGSVVDIGCGVGRWCRRLAPYADRVVGLDHNPLHVSIARELTAGSNIEYRLGDVRQVIGHETFDMAILAHVIEHIDEPIPFLKELHGVADRLAIEVPDFENDPVNLARLAIGREFSSDADHVREYTEATLLATLADSGWAPELLQKRGGGIAVIVHPASSAQEVPRSNV